MVLCFQKKSRHFSQMEKEAFNKLLSQQIRKARLEMKLTQHEVSLRMEIDAQNLSKYERGLISPTVFWIHNFCIAIEKNFSEFMDELNSNLNF